MKLFLPMRVFFVVIFFFVFSGKTIGQISTWGAAYIWSTTTSWMPIGVPASSANVTVNHPLTLDQNLAISTGNYTFNQDVTDHPGEGNYNFSAVDASGSLTIASGTTVIGGVTSIGGNSEFKLTVKAGATLVLGTMGSTSDNFLIGNKVIITIEPGGSIIVYGNIVNSNSTGKFFVNGLLQVYGDYKTNNGNIDINGTGQFYTTGAMQTQGTSSTIYNSSNDCTSNCSGTSLDCGTGGTSYYATILPQSQIVCSGGPVSGLNFSSNVPSPPTYQWESSLTAAGTYTPISGATSSSYFPSPLTVTTWYRVKYTSSSCATTKISAPVPVYVSASTYRQSTAGQTLCGGVFGPISVSALGTDLTYQWYSNTTAVNSGGTLISGANSNVYTPSSAVGGTKYYYCVINSNCGTAFTTAISGAFSINLNTVSAASFTPMLCVNTAMTSITHETTGATGIADDNVSGANGLPSGVSAHWVANTITITGTPTVLGTFNYSIPLTGGCGNINATGTITVNSVQSAPALSNIILECNQTSLSGTAITNLTNYKFGVGLDPEFNSYLFGYEDYLVDSSNYATVTVNGLNSNLTYYVKVRAVNSCGDSDYSPTATISLAVTKSSNGGLNWDNDLPDNKKAVFTGDATITSQIKACSCQIDPGVDIVFGIPGGANADAVLKIENELVVLDTGTLTFENNASLIQVNDVDNIGEIIYKRESTPMKNFDFTYWCSPVEDQKLYDLSPNTLWDKYYSYNNGAWKVEAYGEATMDPAKGYAIRVPKPNVTYTSNGEYWTGTTYAQPVKFIGVPNNGKIEIDAQGTGMDNLIGNPYPSAIDADAFINANADLIDGGLYFWTHNTAITKSGSFYVYSDGDYAVYTLTGGAGTMGNFIDANNNGVYDSGETIDNSNEPKGNIAAGQSFFVTSNATATGKKFEFNNSMRNTTDVLASGSNSQFFRMSKTKKTAAVEKSRVWLNLSNSGGAFKQLLVGYVTGATNEMDKLYDAISYDGNTYVDFYSVNNGNNLTIQGRALPFEETDQIPLGYRTSIEGSFTISIGKTDGVLVNQDIFVEDKVTGIITNLKNGPYAFSTTKGVFNGRFILRFTQNSVTTKIDEGKVSSETDVVLVSVKNKQIKINSSSQLIDKVMIYDLKTSLLYQKESINNNEFVVSNFNSVEQFLIVQILFKNGKWVTKEIIF